MRSRSTILTLVVIAVLAAAALWLRHSADLPSAPTLPLDLKGLLPASWEIVPGKSLQCDFEGGTTGNAQWLVLYRYD